MFCFAVTAAVISLWLAAIPGVAAQGDVSSGGSCNSDIDCAGNLDCARIGMLASKRCMPISCAQGAGQAILDYGFDPDGYIATIMRKTGMKRRTDIMTIDGDALTNAIQSTPPPMQVFKSNYTACVNPDAAGKTGPRQLQSGSNVGSELEAQVLSGNWTAFGIQWSGAALFSYFGKSTYWDRELRADNGNSLTFNNQLVSNCIGVLLGADVGLDFLIQIVGSWDNWEFTDLTQNVVPGAQSRIVYNPGCMLYTPVFTAGPVGVQVGWDTKGGTGKGLITEVTLGASFGASLVGFSSCFNELTLGVDIDQT